jgi:hypothetical protein
MFRLHYTYIIYMKSLKTHTFVTARSQEFSPRFSMSKERWCFLSTAVAAASPPMDRPLVCLPTGHGHPSSSSSASSGSGPATNADSSAVSAATLLDVAGLILYGAQAVPIRLKVLLDRLMAGLSNDQVAQTLDAYGWNYDDYSRGYMLQVGNASQRRA